jgi:hypothetical protein
MQNNHITPQQIHILIIHLVSISKKIAILDTMTRPKVMSRLTVTTSCISTQGPNIESGLLPAVNEFRIPNTAMNVNNVLLIQQTMMRFISRYPFGIDFI